MPQNPEQSNGEAAPLIEALTEGDVISPAVLTWNEAGQLSVSAAGLDGEGNSTRFNLSGAFLFQPTCIRFNGYLPRIVSGTDRFAHVDPSSEAAIAGQLTAQAIIYPIAQTSDKAEDWLAIQGQRLKPDMPVEQQVWIKSNQLSFPFCSKTTQEKETDISRGSQQVQP